MADQFSYLRYWTALSIQGYARAIKEFWSWLAVVGYIVQNPMKLLKVPKTPRKIIATFSSKQLQKLLGSLDLETPSGFKNYTILRVLLDNSIRLSELTGLDITGVYFGQSCFMVIGKSGRDRIVPFDSQVRRGLWRLYFHFSTAASTPACHSGISYQQRALLLRPEGCSRWYQGWPGEPASPGCDVSPHTFRHTFAKEYLVHSGDVFSL